MRTTGVKQSQALLSKLEARESNVNLPNLLTVGRILLIPIFILILSTPTPNRSIVAAIIFVIAAVTDLLDGYLARRHSQVTQLGRFLDPIADKLLVLSGLILLVQSQRVEAIVAILIISREVAVTGIRAIAALEGIVLSTETTGKYKMTAQVVAIVLLILEDSHLLAWNLHVHMIGTLFLYVALLLGLLSGWRYLVQFSKQVTVKSL
jgi:CDP-diacylglycerol--glycerol-3-phosphate 3-phosphatidyltransferase